MVVAAAVAVAGYFLYMHRPASGQADENHSASRPQATTLGKLFVPTTIHGNVAWFESITGPAIQVIPQGDGTQTRKYKVDGCDVTTDSAHDSISAITLLLGPECTVALKAMLPSEDGPDLQNLDFAKLLQAGASNVSLTCAGPDECGNSGIDPSVQAVLGGAHVDDFLEVVFTGTITSDADTNALNALMAAESAHTGKTDLDLDADVYNKDPHLDQLVATKLGGVKVTSITFQTGN